MSEVLDGTDETLAADEPAADVSPQPLPGGFAATAQRWVREHIVALIGVPVGAFTLFVLYLHQARTSGLNSDGSSNALQGWDLLHGNLLLSHWTMSDVSFYLTELPEYALVELVHGLNGDVVHFAAALGYTLAVLLACWLGVGKARGAEALVRILIVLVIMLAPALGVNTVVVLAAPDHFGTSVPLLAIFLVMDRLPERWYTPVILAVLMAWVGLSDSTAIFIAGGGLAIITAMRLWNGVGDRRYEAGLLAAAVFAIAVSFEFPKIIYKLGGYLVHPPNMTFNSEFAMAQAFWVTVRSILDLFGANFFNLPLTSANRTGPGSAVQTPTVIMLLHLFGVGLAVWGVALTLRRLPGQGDRVVKLITAGVLINIVALMFSSEISGGSREIAAALPLGAVVAARVLGPNMVHRKHIALLGAFVVVFSVVLVRDASKPYVNENSYSAQVWLKEHGYKYGLGGYWSANDITVGSGNAVQVRPVAMGPHGIEQYNWESKSTWYDPTQNYANFLVMDILNPSGIGYATPQQAVKQFGKPKVQVITGGQEIMVWDENLLAVLPTPQ